MTVICWDGKFLAVDSMVTYGTSISYAEKLWMYTGDKDSTFVTGYGSWAGVSGLMSWYGSGMVLADFPYVDEYVKEAGMIVLNSNGDLLEYSGSPYPMECPKAPIVWGCGGDIALGAMAMGANAIEAVKAACIHNCACGGDISYATADSADVQFLVDVTEVSYE